MKNDKIKNYEKKQQKWKQQEEDLYELTSFIVDQKYIHKKILADLEYKVENAVLEVEKEKVKTKAALQISSKKGVLATIPLSKTPLHKVITVAVLGFITTKLVKKVIFYEEKEIVKEIESVEDYSKDIISAISDIYQVKKIVKIGILETQELIENIKDNNFLFSNYKFEYKQLMDNLETLLYKLQKNYKEMKNLVDDQEENLDKNKKQLKLIKK